MQLPRWLAALLATHPPLERRAAALLDPRLAFDPWPKDALLIGLFIAGLDLLLASTSAVNYVGVWPLHVSALTAFILLSQSLLLHQILGRRLVWPILGSCLLVVGVRAMLVLLVVGLLAGFLLLAPAALGDTLNLWTGAVTGVADVSASPLISGGSELTGLVWEAAVRSLLQLPILFLALLGAVWTQIWIGGRLLRWYKFPQAETKLMGRIALATTGVAAALAAALIPLTNLVLWRIAWLAEPWGWFIAAVYGAAAVFIGVLLIIEDRRYADRCPSCGERVSSPFVLGRRCGRCGVLLHPWLVAEHLEDV